ncbi:hypothetical protein RYD26_06210 [Pasteurellaceae bacterium LIM206]|nr:hypothetical protein [Pasteurellaceae bacterium LIM206]
MFSLLPVTSQSSLQQGAITRINQQLNQSIVALVGADSLPQAAQLVREFEQALAGSGQFERIDFNVSEQISKTRENNTALLLATVPAEVRFDQAFLAKRSEEIANPFRFSLIPLSQDWLGLQNQLIARLSPTTKLLLDPTSGMLHVREDNKVWILVRGLLNHQPIRLVDLLKEQQQKIKRQGGELLLSGGAIYAELGQLQGARESTWMSLFSLLGVFFILGGAFKTIRLFSIIIPLGLGLLTGILATVIVFGRIHLITLVVGTSLIGVAIDFPLHWLTRAWPGKWYGIYYMNQTWRPFAISLATTLLGYVMLFFTPLPILQQTAVFSITALSSAFACTYYLLPYFFRDWHPKVNSFMPAMLQLFKTKLMGVVRRGSWLWLVLLLVGGVQVQWQDDIRDWAAIPESWSQQAQRIAQLTGMNPTGQFFIVTGKNETELLNRMVTLSHQLNMLKNKGKVGDFTAISQIVRSRQEQQNLKRELTNIVHIDPESLLGQVGVPEDLWQQEVNTLQQLPLLSVKEVLDSPLLERWRPLWLGHVSEGVAAMVTLNDLKDVAALQKIRLVGVEFIDYRAELNRIFDESRWLSALLKLCSLLLAFVLLWKLFGLKVSGKIIFVPLCSMLLTVATLGILGIPLGLFSLFGLLLASAIGIDYAIYAQLAQTSFNKGEPEQKYSHLHGVMLAAATTLMSFMLLAFSHTPAVSHFGMTISIGVVFNLLLALQMESKQNGES